MSPFQLLGSCIRFTQKIYFLGGSMTRIQFWGGSMTRMQINKIYTKNGKRALKTYYSSKEDFFC
jgi:hypothetical protein